MELLVKRVILIVAIAAFLAGEHADAGNPIGDFFKRLGDSIAHPQSSPPPGRKSKKGVTRTKQNDDEQATPHDTPPAVPLVPTSPTPTATPKRLAMPVPMVVRSAIGIPPSKRPPRDVPYGIPALNKPGFVTSPYAPKSGYVDVRSFPSGTEVKDPYTGKVFLVP